MVFNANYVMKSYTVASKIKYNHVCTGCTFSCSQMYAISATRLTCCRTFNGCDVGTMPILAQDVNINCSAGNHPNGSSKVKLSNLVDYNWESKYYTGNLLAVHASGKYFAYALKGLQIL